jgi:hypothetical protein
MHPPEPLSYDPRMFWSIASEQGPDSTRGEVVLIYFSCRGSE